MTTEMAVEPHTASLTEEFECLQMWRRATYLLRTQVEGYRNKADELFWGLQVTIVQGDNVGHYIAFFESMKVLEEVRFHIQDSWRSRKLKADVLPKVPDWVTLNDSAYSGFRPTGPEAFRGLK